MAASDGGQRGPELWVVASYALIALEVALAIYLGMKRPGVGPVRVYVMAPPLIVMFALATGAFGLVWSVMHRPFASSQRLVAFCLLGFVVASATFPLPFPSYRSARPSAVKIHLPVQGEWTVAWGGEGELNFVLRTRPDRCFGFVLVRAIEGSTRAQPDDPRSAHAWGQEVVAPCAGVVVGVYQGRADDGSGGGDHGRAPDDLGNHVVLEIARDEFLFLTGLQQGSLAVREGERVELGRVLGRVGFSAPSLTTPEPHLGIHVQSTPVPLEGQGVPFYFHDLEINGESLGRGVPSGAGLFAGRRPEGDRLRARE